MLCAISLDRYVAIVLATKYQRLLTRRRGYAIVSLIWFTASLLSTPPLIGWSSYQYHPGTLHCSPVWIGQCPYFYFTFAVAVMIPVSLTVFSYIVIFWKIRRHRKRVSMWKNNGKENVSSGETVNESGCEMSQLPTVKKSPGLERRNDGNGTEINVQRQTLSNTSKSPLLTTPVSAQRNTSKGLTEEQITVAENAYPEQRALKFENGGIFYSPKASTSPRLVGKFRAPMIVGEYQNWELRESSSKVKDCSLDVSDGKIIKDKVGTDVTTDIDSRPVDRLDEDGCKLARDEKGDKNGDGQRQSAKQLRIGHLLTRGRPGKSAAVKLSDKDVMELLNLSEGSDAKSSTIMSSEGTSQTEGNDSEKKDVRETDDCQEAKGQLERREINAQMTEDCGPRAKNLSVVRSISGNKKPNMVKNCRSLRQNTSKSKRANRTLREFQVAKTGAILIAVFMVCYGPYTVVHLCHLPFPVPYEAQYFAMWCVFLNSILTPIIYGIMNKETRTKIKIVLKKYWNCCQL